jgi:hypothetical protein
MVIAKEKRKANELKEMIREAYGLPLFLSVHKVPQLGWAATVIVGPNVAQDTQAIVDGIVAPLRLKYDLAD